MKKLYLWMILVMTGPLCHAQLNLEGSAYLQNFDSLGKGLPPGWNVVIDIGRDNPMGTTATLIASPAASTSWTNTGGGFKNMASAKGFTHFAAATTAKQSAASDRALGIKQTSKFGDPGAAFVLTMAQTYGLSDFQLDFHLQSLDSSGGGRSTEWQIEYGFGAQPDTFFSVVASGVLITGNHSFHTEHISVDFGNLLDHSPMPVWIRIVTHTASTGGGSRTSSAIDDVALHWTGTALTEPKPLLIASYPANHAIDVDTASELRLHFSRGLDRGTRNFYISNETDGYTEIIPADDTAVHFNEQDIILPGGLLLPGKTYHITYDSTIADTAGFLCFSSYDTTAWRFTTRAAPEPAVIKEALQSFGDFYIVDHPGTNKIQISVPMLQTAANFSLYHSTGQCIYRQTIPPQTQRQVLTIEPSGVMPGLYLLELKTQYCIQRTKCILR
jgi:hypothetical protein